MSCLFHLAQGPPFPSLLNVNDEGAVVTVCLFFDQWIFGGHKPAAGGFSSKSLSKASDIKTADTQGDSRQKVTSLKKMRWIVVVPLLLECASAFAPLSPHCKGAAPSLSQKSAASRGSQVAREVFGLFGGGGGSKGASEELKELLVESLRNGKALEGNDKIRADALIAE